MKKIDCNFYKDQQSYAGITEGLYKNHEAAGMSRDTDGFKFGKVVTVQQGFYGQAAYVTNKKITFFNDTEINGSHIVGIELMTPANVLHINTNPQTDSPNLANLAKGFLCIVDDCDMELVKMPLLTLTRANNGNCIPMFDLKNINWSACYVRFPSNAGLGVANALQLNVYLK